MPTVAYRVTRRRRKFIKHPQVKRALGAVMDDPVKPHFIQAFDLRVMNWKHKPTFKARKYITMDFLKIAVFPTGEKYPYIWVTLGTRPHTIVAKNARTLAFLWGGPGSYKPKTAPGCKTGGPGTVAGGVMHFPVRIDHPGNEPRNIEKCVRDDNKAWYSRTMENAWRRIIRSL